MIDLRNIETFYWVATLGGFRTAAEKLHATQPAISQRVRALEEGLGVKVFDRDARGVALTAKGQELLPFAERMLRLRLEMLQAVRAETVIRGTLRLGVSETIVHTWLPRLMERLHDAYPALLMEIEVDTSTLLKEQINNHQLDLGFLLGPMTESHVYSLELCEYPLRWLASPRLALGPEPVSLRRIAEWPVITYPASTDPHREIRSMLRGASSDPVRMYGSAAISVIVRMAQDAIGTAVIAPVTAHRALEDGSLRMLEVDAPPLPSLRYTACWRHGPNDLLPRVVAQTALQVAREDALMDLGKY